MEAHARSRSQNSPACYMSGNALRGLDMPRCLQLLVSQLNQGLQADARAPQVGVSSIQVATCNDIAV